MPRSNLNKHFRDERPEWTARKHALLGRYMVPGAMKISASDGKRRAVHLVDGFAGPNEYGGEVLGSTTIMIKAAKTAVARGRRVTVHACEVDPERFATLNRNLAEHLDSGLQKTYNQSHAEAVGQMQAGIGTAPAIIFLDPQTAAQMTLEGDLMPWARRQRTDILGVFMASQACRICASALTSKGESAVAEAFLGPKWREATTESRARELFEEQIKPMKKFAGLYMLRKVEPETNAYGFFGLSDSAHGYWLLSDAVAKDATNLKVADEAKKEPDLFSDMDKEESAETLLQRLVDLARPFVLKEPRIKGDELAITMFEAGVGVQEMFGRYQIRDFTAAKNRILGKGKGGSGNAKAK